MPVKPEQLAAYLGLDLDKFDDDKAMRSAFDGAFLRRDIAHDDRTVQDKVFGKINAVMRQRIKAGAKAVPGLDLGDVDKEDPIELINKLNEGVNNTLQALTKERDELKEAGEKGGSEAAEELTKRIEALTKERDAFGANAKEWERKHTDLFATVQQREHAAKHSAVVESAKARVKFRDGLDEFTRKGFINDFFERHKLDLSGEQPKVLDAAGNIIMDKAKAQTFAALEDLLSEAATAAKLTAVSPQGGAPMRRTVATVTASDAHPATPAAPGQRRTREVQPRF